MQITHDLREEAAAIAEREKGMAEMSEKFRERGAEVYVEAEAASSEAFRSGAP